MNEKRCSKCGEVKRIDAFSKRKRSSDGLRSECKDCCNQYAALYRKGHCQEVVVYKRAYRETHRDSLRDYNHTYHDTNRQRRRQYKRIYYEANREKRLEQDRRYYNAHRQDILERGRAYRAAHRERVLERSRVYRKAHPEVYHTAMEKRRSRKRGAEGHFASADIKHLYETQNGCCAWCSTPLDAKYHIDHVIPLSRGGSNWPMNLVLACIHCNSSKNDKLPYDEWQPPNPLFPQQSNPLEGSMP